MALFRFRQVIKKTPPSGGVSGLFQCRLRGVEGRFSYNYTGIILLASARRSVWLILRACTHNARRCSVYYNRSAQARSEGRFWRRVLTACEAMPTQCQANVNLMHNKRGVQPLKM